MECKRSAHLIFVETAQLLWGNFLDLCQGRKKRKAEIVPVALFSDCENFLHIRDILPVDNATNAQKGCVDQARIAQLQLDILRSV